MWPDSEQTQNLLKSAGEGDARAVNDLMDRHRVALKQLVQMRLDRAIAARVDASDVVQEILVEASQRLGEYIRNPGLPFHLWLRQLAKDQMVDSYRRHRVAQRRSVDRERSIDAAFPDQSSLNLAAQLAANELTPAAATIRRELEQRFLTALAQLNEDDREVMVMRHCEQLSNAEVAAALNLSAPAAGMRYLRAVRRLREILGSDQPSVS
jgi:RNA polymerase sigma-70 factor (ECF subfamily)